MDLWIDMTFEVRSIFLYVLEFSVYVCVLNIVSSYEPFKKSSGSLSGAQDITVDTNSLSYITRYIAL